MYVIPFRTSRGAAETLFSIRGWSLTNVSTLSGSFREVSNPSAFNALFKHYRAWKEGEIHQLFKFFLLIRVLWFSTWPGLGMGTGSGLIQFSLFFFNSLKGPFSTLLMSDRLKTHTADNSSLSLKKQRTLQEALTVKKQKSFFVVLGSPLEGEKSIKVRAARVAWRVLRGEHICQHVVALAAGFVLTHQLRLEKCGPAPLQRLHPPHVRLNR